MLYHLDCVTTCGAFQIIFETFNLLLGDITLTVMIHIGVARGYSYL
jgi:hypothetical protein